MTDKTDDTARLAELRELVRPPVQFLLTRLQKDLGDNLLSLCVVGSALTGDFHPKFSDINTVVVVGRRSHQLLEQLAACGRSMGKRRLRAPLMMTREYIEQSLDVFGVEFLDFQLNHAAVYGPDPFAELSFRKRDVRLQCERQFKAALIKLRQGYISALGKPKAVGGLLLECAGELAVLLRALLWLTDTDRPREALPTLAAAAEKFEFDPAKVAPLMTHRRQRTRPDAGEVDGLFEDIYQVIDHLGRTVDAFGESDDA
ncbi:hypothetical protein LCGC14_0692530 [marine sediment metagenome]|uniref:Polymerase nucleotidyl transferase domain-containing protein n=1 Tax=marine sediment metagenome TaxID=412755 RepID=A0A0F9R5C6_9ZZZZ|nr:hypothetical protein [Phycisphaerae bacterium]HDZ42718.1 hypothetical protein [Phycisphaerae bacterium]